MYIPDLVPYASFSYIGEFVLKAVGWLDNKHDFPKGDVPGEFVTRLQEFCRRPFVVTFGVHYCEFCADDYHGTYILHDQGKVFLGSTDIAVFDEPQSKIAYIAPDMVYHYVVDHNYLPPEAFVKAILNSPIPDTPEYEELLRQSGLDGSLVR